MEISRYLTHMLEDLCQQSAIHMLESKVQTQVTQHEILVQERTPQSVYGTRG